jgi:hypothetical protein
MKIYLVQNTAGAYDGTWVNIDKIYNSREKAQQYIESILTRIYDLEHMRDKLHFEQINEADDIYEAALTQITLDFPDSHYDSWDGNSFQIIERDIE